MNYEKIFIHDLVNGEGVRVTLFVTGCEHMCLGCYNKETWSRKAGKPFTKEIREKLLDIIKDHDGLSLSGGDPLYTGNREEILELCKLFKQRYPDKNIWLWTGYTYDQVKDLEIIKYIDVLIDGRFEKDNKTVKPWRGSNNQELIRFVR